MAKKLVRDSIKSQEAIINDAEDIVKLVNSKWERESNLTHVHKKRIACLVEVKFLVFVSIV